MKVQRIIHAGRLERFEWLLLPRLCVLLLLVVPVGGCVSRNRAEAKARSAFIAGQQEAMARMQQNQALAQGPSVTINGEVRNRVVPWTEGLTLAKALVMADYYGAADPGQIIIVHNGIATRVEPKRLLSGEDIPLQPRDVVQLIPQAVGPKP